MTKCTVVVSTYKRSIHLDRCLQSVLPLHPEIIVVSSGFDSETITVAKSYKATLIERPNSLMLNVNKNYGFSKVKTDWILNLDDDEELTEELIREIKKILTADTALVDGYWIPRKNIIFGKWIRHGVWWPDVQLRLFRKGKGRFLEHHVHEYVQVEGKTEVLESPFTHYNYNSIDQFLYKMEHIYIPSEVSRLEKSGYVVAWYDALRFPLSDFVKLYFFQKGYKDGLHGLILSVFQAFYMFLVFAKLWEKEGFMEKDTSLVAVSKEFTRRYKDISYWLLSAKMAETKNPFLRMWYKLTRRVGRFMPL